MCAGMTEATELALASLAVPLFCRVFLFFANQILSQLLSLFPSFLFNYLLRVVLSTCLFVHCSSNVLVFVFVCLCV